jgi:biliverdin reductase
MVRSLMVRVGLAGTGYAAQKRAEAIATDGRSHLIVIYGSQPERVRPFCEAYGAKAVGSYQDLVADPDIDLVVVSTMNHLHGAIAAAALQAGKHVVVEYPLSLDVAEAEQLIALAHHHQRLLHVEHIELLSGIHQAVVDALPSIGTPFYTQSISLRAESSVPQKWSYHPEQVGFPLVGALSRIQRLVSAFGEVSSVSCQSRFWAVDGDLHETPEITVPYRSCLCSAQLRFTSGLIADVVYGKGVDIWTTRRSLDIHGEKGMIHLESSQGYLQTADGQQELTIGTRQGLFKRDTQMVLDALTDEKPLYVIPEQSLYALKVADAARRSASSQDVIYLK